MSLISELPLYLCVICSRTRTVPRDRSTDQALDNNHTLHDFMPPSLLSGIVE